MKQLFLKGSITLNPSRLLPASMIPRTVIVVLFLCAPLAVFAEVYDLGGMYTFHYRDGRYANWGDFARRGAQLAIDDINNSNMLGDDVLRMLPENVIDYHCWPENAGLMAETLMKKNIIALTGADCSGPAVEIAGMAEKYQVPVISYGANASMLSSPERFPWFVRVVNPSESNEGYLIDLAAYFGVKEIAYFFTTDAWGLGASKVVHTYAERHGIKILKEYSFARDTSQQVLLGYMSEVKDAGIEHIVITTPTPDTVRLFRSLHAHGLNKLGNSFYAAEMILSGESPEVVYGSLGYFAPAAMLAGSKKLTLFRKSLEQRLDQAIDPDSITFITSALSYDHIMAIAHSIKAIKLDGKVVNRDNLMSYLRAMDFAGITGRVSLAAGSNDRANMPIQIFNNHGYKADQKTVKFVSIGFVDTETGMLVINEDAILWPGSLTPE
ncbi:MAG: ABC transporter substrate-binding protein [Gammaproteobacteria bacterium]|jgi:ABC-type branched-subunit amino acid transport system substrate-binding protein|nr:ABC transporter substrate-binding protein [Gammaproteobacteria bacterium]MBT5204127.1 ABC transporter substrate-binding protein [Gammaproteobacteria bacterium]MBT5604281.1 ABC transporter substrate-binding protein [Gammaproteobacteria bacterium]MBT6244657.1 ABC transporter substrate-binding protein [Gammaproteobacteria bacterium]